MNAEEILALIDQSQALEQAGEMSGALQQALQAVEAARSANKTSLLAQALVALARVRFRMGQFQVARTLAAEALELAKPGTPAFVEATWRLAACAAETGSLSEAETLYHRTVQMARETGHHMAHAAALHSLAAAIYMRRGQFDLALAADEEAYWIYDHNQLTEFKVVPLVTIGLCCLVTGNLERARPAIAELGQLAAPGTITYGYFLYLKALMALEENDIKQSVQFLQQARSIAESTGEPGLTINILLTQSMAHLLDGQSKTAHDWAEEALAFTERVGYHLERGDALVARALARWQMKHFQAAREDLTNAIVLNKEAGAAYKLARSLVFQAALQHQMQDPEAEATWIEAASQLLSGGYFFLLEQERQITFPLAAAYLGNSRPEIHTLTSQLIAHLESVVPPPLQIYTLGRFEVYRQGKLIPGKAWRRQAGELFRLLLLSPAHSLSRDQIIETLWPEKDAASALAFFHQATSALRRALEPDLPDKFPSRYIRVEEGKVTLILPPGSTVDYLEFEEKIHRHEFHAALAIYQGEPFPDDRYRDWASWKREHLIQNYIQALIHTAQSHLQAQEAEKALEACQKILLEDPWHEQAVYLGMQAHIMQQNRIGALRMYRDFEQKLQAEFGIEPSEPIRNLYQSIR